MIRLSGIHNMLRDSKLVIATSFLLVLALMVALIGTGLVRMTAIQQRMETIAHTHNSKIDLIMSMRHIVQERSLSLYAMYLTDDRFAREEEYRRFSGMAAEFIALRERLVTTGLNDTEQALLAEALARIRTGQSLQVGLAERILSGGADGARATMLRELRPLEKDILALFDRMIGLERAASRAAVEAAAREYRAAYVLMAVLGLAALVVGVVIAWYVVRRTRRIENALSQEKEQAEVTLHSVGDGVITTDAGARVVYLNPAAEQLTGWRTDEARGKPLSEIYRVVVDLTRRPIEHPAFLGPLDGPVVGVGRQALLLGRAGGEHAIEDSASPIRDAAGAVIGAVLVFRDVTQARSLERLLTWQATRDPLTGLANRREFERQLERLLAAAREQDRRHTLLYLDLDQFKVVNDTCGHVAGDELLKQLAGAMQPLVRDSDLLARLGGDEFGVVLEGCSVAQAEHIAGKLRAAIQSLRFTWEGKTFRVGASIGLVGIDAASGSPAAVMSAADTACYVAKGKGRNRIWVHQPDDREVQARHGEMQWVGRLNQAFEEDRFRLYVQHTLPLSAAARGSGYSEALIRLVDERGEVVPPMTFIPAAERYDLMNAIDRWVVKRAFEWLARHSSGGRLAVNLSGQSLGDEGLLAYVTDQFAATGLNPDRVCFEITETVAVANWTRTLHFVNALRGMDCHFALDDFGSGMSSFGYLKSLPVDYVKIGGMFVRDMIRDQVDYAMVEAINRLGHVMELKTIAENVEDERILEKLKELGVDYAQGFAIHAPQPLEEAARAAAASPAAASPAA